VNPIVADTVMDQFKGATKAQWIDHKGADDTLCRNPMVPGGSIPVRPYEPPRAVPGSIIIIDKPSDPDRLIHNILQSHRQAVASDASFAEEVEKLLPSQLDHDEHEAQYQAKRLAQYHQETGDNFVREVIAVLELSDNPYCTTTCQKLNQVLAR
jgi:hypothetical protein